MVVDIDLGQGGDIDLEAGVRRKLLRHLVVQAVDAFDDEDVVLTELTEVAAVLALSGDEVVDRQLHGLPREEFQHILAELFDIDALDRLEILLSIRTDRRELAIPEVIIDGDRVRMQAEGHELDAEPTCEGRLAGARRAGDHDELLIPLRDLHRDVADRLLEDRLLHQDELIGTALDDAVVQGADIAAVDGVRPGRRFLLDLIELVQRHEGRDMLRIPLRREHQDEAAAVRHEVEGPDIARVHDHIAIVVVEEIPEAVDVDPARHTVVEQALLARHADLTEHLDRFVGLHALLHDRNLLIPVRFHRLLHFGEQRLRHLDPAVQIAVEATAEGIVDHDAEILYISAEVIEGLQHHENRGALVSHVPFLVRARDEADLTAPLRYTFMKLIELRIELRKQDLMRNLRLMLHRDFIKCRARWIFPSLSLYCDIHILSSSDDLRRKVQLLLEDLDLRELRPQEVRDVVHEDML